MYSRLTRPTTIACCLFLFTVCALSEVGTGSEAGRAAPVSAPGGSPAAGGTEQGSSRDSDEFDLEQDSLEPFVPRRRRTEAEQDRIEALGLFAAARMKEQKQDFAGALRLYERALRNDPRALQAVREIVPLAFNLGRSAEAVRYALKAADLDASDPLFLRRLGVHLTSQGDFERALKLYEKALALEARGPADSSRVLLSAQMGKLYVITQQYPKAAQAFAEVMAALDAQGEAQLDARTRGMIFEDATKTLDLLSAKVEGRPDEASAYDLFGLAMLEGDDLDHASSAFGKANEVAPNAGVDGYQRAQVLARKKQPAEALEALNAYFEAHLSARGSAPYELLATLLADLGQSDQLLGRLEQLLAADAANVPLRYCLADRYREAGNLEKAEPLYTSALSARPAMAGYRGLIEIYRRTAKPEPLLKLLVESLTQLRSLELLNTEVKAVCGDGPLMDQLLELARKEHQQKPQEFNASALLAVGSLALESGRYDAAAEFFETAIKADPREAGSVLRRWGLSLLVKERYTDAVRVFQRALDENLAGDNGPEFYYHLAGAQEMLGRTDEALAAARRAVELAEPKSTTFGDLMYRFYARVPWVLYHAKRYAEARESYAAELSRFDSVYDNDEARNSAREARLMLSNLAMLDHDSPQAEEWLEQILDEFPDNISALNDLGYLWAEQGKHLERALGMIDMAVAGEPKNSAYLDSRGWALYRLGRFGEAIAALDQAVALDPDPDGVILDHLGDACLAAGERDRALAAWQRAVGAFDKAQEKEKQQATQAKIDTVKIDTVKINNEKTRNVPPAAAAVPGDPPAADSSAADTSSPK